jgi:hypothetical protein
MDEAQLNWPVVQPLGTMDTNVVGAKEVDTQPLVIHEKPSEQHFPPYEVAHWYAENAEHGRWQQAVVVVAIPVVVNVALHRYCDTGQGRSQVESIAQHDAWP